MLMVTDLLQVALGRRAPAELRARSSGRFDPGHESPLVVVWNVCRTCNERCPHCYIAAGTAPAPNDLDTPESLRLLERLAQGGVRVVIFSGGEPLMHPDLVELVHACTRLGMAPQLSSNGTLLDAALADRLKAAGLRYVGISLDGLAALNDSYRGLVGGFDKAIHGLRAARSAGMRTGLRMTLTRRNLDQIDDLLDLAIALPIDRFYISHLVYAGRGRRMQPEDLTPVETRAAELALFARAEDIVQRAIPISIVTGANDSDGVLLLQWIRERHGERAADGVRRLLDARGGNSAGEGVLSIDPGGLVHPDPFWRTITLGDLRRDSLQTVLEHPLLADLRRREQLLEGRCGVCRWKSLCRGGHRARAEATTGSIWGADPACVMTDAEIGITPEAATA